MGIIAKEEEEKMKAQEEENGNVICAYIHLFL
jgi:predicted RNase H-like nuclease